MWIRDPETKTKSVTLNLFVYGFIICTFKLLFSGITVGPVKLSEFGGGDYAAALGALGAVYTLRKYSSGLIDKSEKEEK